MILFSYVIFQVTQAHCYTDNTCIAHSHGDPHFRMFGGYNFDYHGECDLVLVNNTNLTTGAAVRIHVRTKILTWYSYIASAAVLLDNEIFEIEGRKLYLNKKRIDNLPNALSGYTITMVNSTRWCEKKNCTGAIIVNVDLGEDGGIQITSWKGFLYVQVTAEGDGFLGSTGIMGTVERDGLYDRNGSPLSDEVAYAEEWQVLNTEPKLFASSRYPQHPVPCVRPVRNSRRIVDEDSESYRAAAIVCSVADVHDRDFCITDVLATGDTDMAMPYIGTAY